MEIQYKVYPYAPLKSIGRRPLASISSALAAIALAIFFEASALRIQSRNEAIETAPVRVSTEHTLLGRASDTVPTLPYATLGLHALSIGFTLLSFYLIFVGYIVQYVERDNL